MEWISEANREKEALHKVFSFDEYMDILKQNPIRECRTSSLYLKNMFEYFEKYQASGPTDSPQLNEKKEDSFGLFNSSEGTNGPVFGQHVPQKQIYQNIINFIEEGFNNKFILLVGPNGSSKSSIVKKIMEGAEAYSKTDDGMLFTFSWIFPIDTYVKGTLGLSSKKSSHAMLSYAHLEDKDISSILPSELKDHPFLLIPMAYRQKLIQEMLAHDPKHLEYVKKTYLYHGDISKRNRMIFDALLKSYQGQYEEVFKHIRVERIEISKRYSSGAVTIEPQLHVDVNMQQITMDKRLASLPPRIQSLNLFSMQGENVLANRGILEFSDLLKRPLDAFKYLLMTMESKTINIQGILTELDIFFIGTSNEIHLTAFKQHPDYNSFRGRFNIIRVPYLLNYVHEEAIYRDQVKNLRDKCHFEPHSIATLSLWAVMTRLRPCLSKNFKEKRLQDIVVSLSPLEKALFIAESKIPNRFDSEERKILNSHLEEVRAEFSDDALYEGKFGISPREIKHIIYEISSIYKSVTFMEILDYLGGFILKKNEFEFLNMAPQGDFLNPIKFLSLLKEYELEIVDQQLRDCLGLIDDRSYEEYIERYIQNINCLLKGEKMKNPITGRFEEVDMYSIKEFETNIKLKETPEKFRSHMLSTLGAYSLDNPNKKIVYSVVFFEIVKTLKESFRLEQKKAIVNIAKNMVFYIKEFDAPSYDRDTSTLSKEDRDSIENVLHKLCEKYSYSKLGALSLLRNLINEKY